MMRASAGDRTRIPVIVARCIAGGGDVWYVEESGF